MKKILMLVLSLALTGGLAQAQTKDKDKDKDKDAKKAKATATANPSGNTMDSASEKAVHITSGPTVANLSATSATMNWTTDKAGANDVHYNCGTAKDKIAYHKGGGTQHSVTLTGLKPGSTCSWKIMTHDGDIRQQGSFQTPAK